MFRFLVDCVITVSVITLLSSMAVGAEKELTYDEMMKKEETARLEELKKEEASWSEEDKVEEVEVGPSKDSYIEVKDDAGYTKGNESKERVRMDREWFKLHDGFDQPNK